MKRRLISLLIVMAMSLTSLLVLASCKSQGEIAKLAKGLTNYTINAEYNNTDKTVTANQKVEYKNNTDAVMNTLDFHLYGNAYREGASFSPIKKSQEEVAYPNGKSYGSMNVTSLKLNGSDQAVSIGGQDMDILTVNLDKPLYPDNMITIEMSFELKLANVSHRLGYDGSYVNLGNWFPIASVYENGAFVSNPYYSNGDPFYSELANFDVSLKADKSLVVASTGSMYHTADEGETRLSCFKASVVRDFAMVLSSEFKVLSEAVDNTTLNYYYVADSEPEKSMQTAKASLTTFGELMGTYPYETLAVVETSFLHGGMEYPNLVYISHMAESDKYQEIIAHEIAHQWIYGIVGNNPIQHAWMDEGLTEYLTTIFFEKNPSYNITKTDRISQSLRNYLVYVDVYKSIKGDVDTSMNRASNAFNTESEYTYMTYVKGELMFDTLRTSIGEKAFFEGIKYYYNEYKFKTAQPVHLISSFERTSKTNLTGFFDSWLEGKILIGDVK